MAHAYTNAPWRTRNDWHAQDIALRNALEAWVADACAEPGSMRRDKWNAEPNANTSMHPTPGSARENVPLTARPPPYPPPLAPQDPPGSARVDETGGNARKAQREAAKMIASAQREAGDRHRAYLDKKYKKRAWKKQMRNTMNEDQEVDVEGYPEDLRQRSWHELLARAP